MMVFVFRKENNYFLSIIQHLSFHIFLWDVSTFISTLKYYTHLRYIAIRWCVCRRLSWWYRTESLRWWLCPNLLLKRLVTCAFLSYDQLCIEQAIQMLNGCLGWAGNRRHRLLSYACCFYWRFSGLNCFMACPLAIVTGTRFAWMPRARVQ